MRQDHHGPLHPHARAADGRVHRLRGPGADGARRQCAAAGAAPDAGDLPGSVQLAEPPDDRGADPRGAALRPWHRAGWPRRGRRGCASSCSRSVSCRSTPGGIRISSRVASGSGWALPGPSRWSRPWSSAMSRCRRSTSRSRHRSSTSWRISRRELRLTYLFVAHDLSVVRHISDRVAVMYLGRIVELADRQTLYDAPVHPYTRALLSAVPIPDPELELHRERIVLGGEVPSPLSPAAGMRLSSAMPDRRGALFPGSPRAARSEARAVGRVPPGLARRCRRALAEAPGTTPGPAREMSRGLDTRDRRMGRVCGTYRPC